MRVHTEISDEEFREAIQEAIKKEFKVFGLLAYVKQVIKTHLKNFIREYKVEKRLDDLEREVNKLKDLEEEIKKLKEAKNGRTKKTN